MAKPPLDMSVDAVLARARESLRCWEAGIPSPGEVEYHDLIKAAGLPPGYSLRRRLPVQYKVIVGGKLTD